MSFIMLYPKLWPFFIDRKRWSMDLPSFPIFWDKLQVLHFLPIIFNMMRSCVYCLWLLLSPFEMMYWCYCRKRIRQVCDLVQHFSWNIGFGVKVLIYYMILHGQSGMWHHVEMVSYGHDLEVNVPDFAPKNHVGQSHYTRTYIPIISMPRVCFHGVHHNSPFRGHQISNLKCEMLSHPIKNTD